MAKEKKVVTTTTVEKAIKPTKEKKKKVTTTVTTTVTEETITIPLNEKTHIICVLDRSGSMTNIMQDMIGGFNDFLKKQMQLSDSATLTVHLFDDKHECLYDYVDIKEAKELTASVWYPRGCTALYDAIGLAVNKAKAKFALLGDEKPSKVLVCVVTDGYENASKEFKRSDIQNLIKSCEECDWNFIYLACNQNAFAVGQSFGISYANTHTYTASAAGVMNMSMTLNNATSSYRGMSSNDGNFKKMSKSLINDDPNKAVVEDKDNNSPNNSGNLTGQGFTAGIVTDSPNGIVTDSPNGIVTDSPNGIVTDSPNGTTTTNLTGNVTGNVTGNAINTVIQK